MKAFVEFVSLNVADVVTTSGTTCVQPDTTGSDVCTRGED